MVFTSKRPYFTRATREVISDLHDLQDAISNKTQDTYIYTKSWCCPSWVLGLVFLLGFASLHFSVLLPVPCCCLSASSSAHAPLVGRRAVARSLVIVVVVIGFSPRSGSASALLISRTEPASQAIQPRIWRSSAFSGGRLSALLSRRADCCVLCLSRRRFLQLLASAISRIPERGGEASSNRNSGEGQGLRCIFCWPR